MNSIINQNLGSGNNSMNSLQFFWKARFTDNSEICQFDYETGIEHKFKEVIDRFDSLKCFHLYHKIENLNFTVDLISGVITFNKKSLIEKTDKKNIRLIFFRRHRIEIGTKTLKEESHTIEYHIGLQWQDSEKRNQKIILIIDKEGSWILGDN